jgi:hypothetical protein
VGVLRAVEKSAVGPSCVLTIAHNNQHYLGTLAFDDEKFFKQICDILTRYIGEPISAIGSLDVS